MGFTFSRAPPSAADTCGNAYYSGNWVSVSYDVNLVGCRAGTVTTWSTNRFKSTESRRLLGTPPRPV